VKGRKKGQYRGMSCEVELSRVLPTGLGGKYAEESPLNLRNTRLSENLAKTMTIKPKHHATESKGGGEPPRFFINARRIRRREGRKLR